MVKPRCSTLRFAKLRMALPFALALGIAAGAVAGAIPATAGQSQTGAVLRSVTVSREGALLIVSLEADAALPTPTSGTVSGPPRIYLDFVDVLPATRGTVVAGHPIVRRVRVALHSPRPKPVTRVVIDLDEMVPYRIDPGGDGNRVRIVIGEAGQPQPAPASPADVPAPVQPPPVPAGPPSEAVRIPATAPPAAGGGLAPVPSLPAGAPASSRVPPPPAATAPVDRSRRPPPIERARGSAALPVKDVERYRSLTAGALQQLLSHRAVLLAIDTGDEVPVERLGTIADDLEQLKARLAGIEPPASVRAAHELLTRACALGAMAVRLRAEAAAKNSFDLMRNAASAAAGANMLLERACGDLGCAPPAP